MSLTQSLEDLVDVVESRGRPIRHKLRPGLARSEVRLRLEEIGLTAPDELCELYEWHDGVDDPESTSTPFLFAEQQFLPLEDAVRVYKDLLKYNLIDYPPIKIAQCFTFATFMGDDCAIYCDPTPIEGLQYPVIDIFESIGVVYENIDKMAQTAMAWFVAGLYDSSESGDDNLRWSIRAKLNLRIKYFELPNL